MILEKNYRSSIKILTTQGYIQYKRYVLNPSDKESKEKLHELGRKSVVPLDEYLGLDAIPFKITPMMAVKLAKECIMAGSYAEVEARLLQDQNIKISDDTLRMVTDYVGELVHKEHCRNARALLSTYDTSKLKMLKKVGRPKKNPFILYMETDGAMYLAREEGDIQKGWHEHKLGMVFTSKSLKEHTNDKGEIVYTIGDREYISNIDGVEAHRNNLLALAIKNGLYEADLMIIITDGAEWIHSTEKNIFPYAIPILDFFHLMENVRKFAEFDMGASNPETKPWIDKVCKLLEEGKWKEVLDLPELKKYADGKAKVPKGVVNLYTYIENNKDRIDYPTYRKLGYFYGSGAIESGNKNVGHKRIKQSGMRWLPSKAQGVLVLRCKLLSGLWEEEVVSVVNKNYKLTKV